LGPCRRLTFARFVLTSNTMKSKTVFGLSVFPIFYRKTIILRNYYIRGD